VNTAQFQDRFQYQLTPDVDLLKLYRNMGGSRITLGSDAHIPTNVGLGFHSVRKILRDLGYEYCYYYEKRTAKKIAL
jgi:histidinol-phosphatase (PHP family)